MIDAGLAHLGRCGLRARLWALAHERRRFVYRRLFILLWREGEMLGKTLRSTAHQVDVALAGALTIGDRQSMPYANATVGRALFCFNDL